MLLALEKDADEKGTVELDPSAEELRFGHYQVLQRDDDRPFELGRGSMGITYKAFDVDLHRPVTLKVINARYLNDESARTRFVREARAAAAVRHPNVATVFHLGKKGDNYFYAMEFVPGETLEQILRQTGRLDLKTAVEITSQIAAGLSATILLGDSPRRNGTSGPFAGAACCNPIELLRYKAAPLQGVGYLRHPETFSGAACCKPIELPRYKAAPLQTNRPLQAHLFPGR